MLMNRPPEQPRKALGKGLSALLPTRPATIPVVAEAQAPGEPAAAHDGATRVPVDAIDPNPVQPRRVFESAPLEELAQSIRANGIIQPLVVRRLGDRLQLVA